MEKNVSGQNNAVEDLDYLKEALQGNIHVTLAVNCPRRVEKGEENYRMLLGKIFDLGVKQYYKSKGYATDMVYVFPITDKVRLVGTVDLMIETHDGIRVIEVKLTDFSEYTITKGLLQLYAYSRMIEKITGRNVIPELWCFSLNKFAVHKPQYNEKTFIRIIERAVYIWSYANKNSSLPPIPSRLDCMYCREKFICPLYGRKIEDLEL